MEKSVGTAIEKIKLQEQDNEAKLKEKREFEATIVSLKRGIRDAFAQSEKAKQEKEELIQKTDRMTAKLEIQNLYKTALSQQLEASSWELNQLRAKSDQGMSEVWALRARLGQSVQQVSNECDVWALLMKPMTSEPVLRPQKTNEESPPALVNEDTLKEARGRRERSIKEKKRLLTEPDNGEEFIRKAPLLRTCRSFSNRPIEASENEPIKFSTSPAARRVVAPVIKIVKNDMPWYQPYSVIGSVAVFMLYFCILREESDIDTEFSKTLYDRIQGLEKEQLLQSYRFNKENNLSVVEIELRLKELEAAELKEAESLI